MQMILVNDWEGGNEVREVSVLGKIGKDGTVNTSIGLIYAAYLYPLEAREELESILKTRQELKKALDDSMKLVYEFSNRWSGKKGF